MFRLYTHKNDVGVSLLFWNGAVSITVGMFSVFIGSTKADEFIGVGFSFYPFDKDQIGAVFFSTSRWYDF